MLGVTTPSFLHDAVLPAFRGFLLSVRRDLAVVVGLQHHVIRHAHASPPGPCPAGPPAQRPDGYAQRRWIARGVLPTSCIFWFQPVRRPYKVILAALRRSLQAPRSLPEAPSARCRKFPQCPGSPRRLRSKDTSSSVFTPSLLITRQVPDVQAFLHIVRFRPFDVQVHLLTHHHLCQGQLQ